MLTRQPIPEYFNKKHYKRSTYQAVQESKERSLKRIMRPSSKE